MLICCDMLATEQQIVEGVKTVTCCDMLATWQHICNDSSRKNDGEQLSNPGSLATGDGIYYAFDPNVENQSTHIYGPICYFSILGPIA